jgi:TPR repeat protein
MNAQVQHWWEALSPADLQVYIAGSPAQAAEVMQVYAHRGEPEAQAQLGQMLLSGHGMAADPLQALHWFGRAAKAGHPMARNMLGRCHQYGWGCRPDIETAAGHYRIAAEQGLDWGLYNYAMLLTAANGVERDTALAFTLFQRAAEAGHAKSMNLLGRFYEEGIAVQPDVALAHDWYRRAAEAGDFRGQYSHAGVLLAADDVDAALPWLQQALHRGNLNFLRQMRSDLLRWPHPAVREIALGFYRRAAELGDASDRAALNVIPA